MWIDQALAKTGVPKDPLDLINAVKSIELTDAPRGVLKIDDYNSPIEIEDLYYRRGDDIAA